MIILRPDHPLLRGLRFFAVVDNVAKIVPEIGGPGGGPGVVTRGTGSRVQLHNFGGLLGDGAATVTTFGNFSSYWSGPTSNDMTLITRCKSTLGNQIAGVLCSRSGGTTAGWQLLYSNAGGGEDGYNFTVFSTAGKFVEAQDGIGHTAQANQEVVVAGTWDNTAKKASIYTRQPGDNYAAFRSVNTNTSSGNINTEPWNIQSTAPILTHNLNGFSLFFTGVVSWFAIFNRVLTRPEIVAWSRDEEWEFAQDYPALPNFGIDTFRTNVGVSGSPGLITGPRTYRTNVEARAFVDGDITGGPAGPVTRTFRTTVGTVTKETIGSPLLKKYTTVVSANSREIRSSTRKYGTKVGVRQSGSQRIDGRIDLLLTGQYRR